MTKSLRECVREAEKNGTAIGHFNVSNIEMLHGIYEAAKNVSALAGRHVPVIVGVSENEEIFLGREEIAALVHAIRVRDNYPIFLNADHHYKTDKITMCIDAGFDSIVFDGAKLSFDENTIAAKKVVKYARKVTKETGRDVLVEAELGYIGAGSDIKDKVPEGAGMKTLPEDAARFVKETGIDLFAPSVGNIHGIIKGYEIIVDPILITEIKKAVNAPLVLHGGSGISDENMKEAIKAGISIVHISTELRVAYSSAVKRFLKEKQEEIVPYKIAEPGQEAVKIVVEKKLKLFNNLQ